MDVIRDCFTNVPLDRSFSCQNLLELFFPDTVASRGADELITFLPVFDEFGVGEFIEGVKGDEALRRRRFYEQIYEGDESNK